jgi:hypothetical protein
MSSYSKENEVISKAADVTYFDSWQAAGTDWYKVWIKVGDKVKVGYVSKQNAVVEGGRGGTRRRDRDDDQQRPR